MITCVAAPTPRAAAPDLFRRPQAAASSESRVEDRVAVALLGEEALAVLREVLVDGVAGDERVEVRGQPALLRAQQAAEALGLLLARAERSGDLDGDGRLGQVDREVRDLRHHEHLGASPSRNSWYSRSRSSIGVAPVSFGRVQRLGELVDLVEVLADHEDALALVLRDQLACTTPSFAGAVAASR